MKSLVDRVVGLPAEARRSRLVVSAAAIASVVALGVAQPALAKKSEESTRGEWKPLEHCPVNAPEISEPPYSEQLTACVWARSESSSEFQAGNVTVHLTQPITLQGGFYENEETGQEDILAAPEDGALTLKPVKQPAPSLENDVEPSLLPPAEKARYEKDVAGGKTKTTATIELAGPARAVLLSEGNLLNEEGTALELPVKVKLTNGFFGKTCYVGSNVSPIVIELTTGTSGSLKGLGGNLTDNAEGTIATISNDSLVNNTYAAPGVEGCGKEAGAADAAINAKLGLPSLTPGSNKAVINGILKQSSRNETKEHLEKFGLS